MITTIAIDDEPPALKVIETFCAKTDFIKLQKTFTKPSEALKHLHKYPTDLLFLDIQMPSVSGIDFYKSITHHTMVIFTTAHSQYAVEGFNLNAIDYLLKPYTFERFLQAAQKAQDVYRYNHQGSSGSDPFLLIRADYKLIKILLAEILYIESLDDYLKIHLENQKTIVARMTMKDIMSKLPEKAFARVHRSYIVPLKRIKSVSNKTIFLEQLQISIGNRYEAAFFALFKS